MTPKQIDTALQKLNLVLEDLQMLRDGTWIPDAKSCEATIDNLNEVINIIENE
jgi:hypothetical protein